MKQLPSPTPLTEAEQDQLALVMYRNYNGDLIQANQVWSFLCCRNLTSEEFAELVRRQSDSLPDVGSISFARYGDPFHYADAQSLIDDPDCVARVELSGCEGFYVEVVRFDNETGWMRYAFAKCFERPKAEAVAKAINANSELAPVFGKMRQGTMASGT